MKRMLLLGLIALVLIVAAPGAATAQCSIECVRLVDPETQQHAGYGCTTGSNDDCNPSFNSCWMILCHQAGAIMDEFGRATATVQLCDAGTAGELTITPIGTMSTETDGGIPDVTNTPYEEEAVRESIE